MPLVNSPREDVEANVVHKECQLLLPARGNTARQARWGAAVVALFAFALLGTTILGTCFWRRWGSEERIRSTTASALGRVQQKFEQVHSSSAVQQKYEQLPGFSWGNTKGDLMDNKWLGQLVHAMPGGNLVFNQSQALSHSAGLDDQLGHILAERLKHQLVNALQLSSEEASDIANRSKELQSDIDDLVRGLNGSDHKDDVPASCTRLDGLYIDRVLHSNLGGQGPDVGEESLIFESNHTSGNLTTKLAFKITANSNYDPGMPRMNGLSHGLVGKYGMIVVKPGTSVNLTFRTLNAETGQSIRMPSADFTFFDLDEAAGHTETEFITVGSFERAEISQGSEVQRIENTDGTTTFQASTWGNFADNPVDPLLLTAQQKNRAVTLTFKDTEEFSLVLGSTAGNSSLFRGFTFVGQPALRCAKLLPAGNVESAQGEEALLQVLIVPGAVASLLLLIALLCCCGGCCG